MTTHTPGSWKIHGIKYWDHLPAIFELLTEDDTHIASVRDEADARLIAAAPELLAACEAIAKWWHTRGIEGTAATDELAAMARHAIAKTRGER